MPVLVRDVPNEAAAAMALIENIQREDLNPLEEAQACSGWSKFGLTHELAAQAVGRSRSAASNLLRLLNLAEPVQTMLMAGDIDMGHARACCRSTAPRRSRRQPDCGQEALGARGRSPGQAHRCRFQPGAAKAQEGKIPRPQACEEELSDLLMADVEVRVKSA